MSWALGAVIRNAIWWLVKISGESNCADLGFLSEAGCAPVEDVDAGNTKRVAAINVTVVRADMIDSFVKW
jgi:hypothetical protein